MARRILFVVETGWRGMREASLAFIKNGLSVEIIIKGVVKKEILDIITRPSDKYRICAFPKWFFKGYLFFYILRHKITGELKTVVVSKEWTKNWVKGFGVDVKLLLETENGYTLKV